ncbi:hypothetical protein D3C86_1986840 [compost metagenome]
MWERGLKYKIASEAYAFAEVAPYAGAWIEIIHPGLHGLCVIVAPYAGAWIEMAGSTPRPHWFIRRSLCGSVD